MEADFAIRCVAIDLEVRRGDGRIHKIAAIRGDVCDKWDVASGRRLDAALAQLDRFSVGAEFVIGHNLIEFDLKHLRAANPKLGLLQLPPLDTLRLSPLAFPRHPYHHLIKHYQDAGLIRSKTNDPELDTRICLQLLRDEQAEFVKMRDSAPALLAAWHYLCSATSEDVAFDHFFAALRGQPRPHRGDALEAMERSMRDLACPTAIGESLAEEASHAWPLAYALAWLSVAGSNSVMPPWVRHQYPGAADVVRRLRDTRCTEEACPWCRVHHNPQAVLQKWFHYPSFRPEPACEYGRSMQEAIAEAAMRREHVLGILPTGTGKSICYQVPALSRYENTGALTVVISPLQALMADQVAGLEARGIASCAALNGLLSMPERHEVLQKVRLGDIAMLIVSPEQLRNPGFRKAVKQREIGAWVLDEAHCLSKWGQDFRTDYRYVGRFIRESAGDNPPPPVLCLTATAKPDVVKDIRDYFKSRLNVELTVYNGGANRSNLSFEVMVTNEAHKLTDIHSLLVEGLPETGGAIVYCATRAQTESVARFLSQHGLEAAHFHAGLQSESKKATQREFIEGSLRVIVATNAFGMGIDKPDVRLVIHADIPGSLENYVQEAGRAGRDGETARCVLLYCKEDVEQQFRLSSSSRIARHEIQRILRTLRRMARSWRDVDGNAEFEATPGEILSADESSEKSSDRDRNNTRVRTALAWLEEAQLAFREENNYQVFPSSLRITSAAEAAGKLQSVEMPYREKLSAIVGVILCASSTDAVTTDDLMGVAGLNSEGIKKALHDLERLGIINDDTRLTAHVYKGVEKSSTSCLEKAMQTEKALIGLMRELAPDMEKGETHQLPLRQVSQHLQEEGHAGAHPDKIYRILQSVAADGRDEEGGVGSVQLRKLDAEFVLVTLRREWDALQTTALLRRTASACLLAHLLERLSPGKCGTELVVETTLGALHAAIEGDLELKGLGVRKPEVLIERGLLWLHEQEVIHLGKGMVIFKPSMTIRVPKGSESFTQDDYKELADHYREQAIQIFVMQEYARLGLQQIRDAAALVQDYFQSHRDDFIGHWFRGREEELGRQTTTESWAAIVEALNRTQRHIVTDNREKTNVLILAGPGSGKTRVLVHRIAYLVRARRESPGGILALAYNRHAAVQIRQRLHALIGDDAKRVTVLTCHGLAMRLTGTSFQGRTTPSYEQFASVMRDAVMLLKGEGMLPEEADGQRDRLLSGFRWILVDEYQDVAEEQYELISALAGRTLTDAEHKLSLFAVGDDDQNIYAFSGASIAFIRRFQEDYAAKPSYLIENYRSSGHIIAAANAVIASARERMKLGHDISVDEDRKTLPPGGRWEALDPLARGRVQILAVGNSFESQACAVMEELQRLSSLDPKWDWCKCAVIAREWRMLDPVRAWCEIKGVPVQMANEPASSFWFLRETQALLDWLNARKDGALKMKELLGWLESQARNAWWELLREAMSEYAEECGGDAMVAGHFREWLYDWGCELRRRQRGLLLLTAHRAKGLEFDQVAVLDGGWNRTSANEDRDATRRLYYVAMARARETLVLSRLDAGNGLLDAVPAHLSHTRAAPSASSVPANGLDCQYRVLEMKEVDLGYAGCMREWEPCHRDIQLLQPEDPLTLVKKGENWYLNNAAGRRVGRLSKGFTPPKGMYCREARVHAVLVWSKEGDASEYNSRLRCDRWETVLPELVFAPCAAE